ncbi:MAG: DUF169 domain-containing protein [Pseudomonadota bacterium]
MPPLDAGAAPAERLYRRLQTAFDAPLGDIPATVVTFFKKDTPPPRGLLQFTPDSETVMCCQAVRHAAGGEPVLLTSETIGCIAAGISLGLLDQDDPRPAAPPRHYTEMMRRQAAHPDFTPPSPRQFTDGQVYACHQAGRPEFGLFGPGDSGRFATPAVARKAIAGMAAIQPAVMAAVLFTPVGFTAVPLAPDVVVLAVRPVVLSRILQGYQYLTGKSVHAVMHPVRAVDSDLIARPYLTGDINVSPYCLGARLVARYGGDLMGIGIPFAVFSQIVDGMEQSRSGYPFSRYPGALGA